MKRLAAALALASGSPAALAQPAGPAVVATVVTSRPSPIPGTLLVERDTLVRLMVLNEVTTKTARVGDRFVLIVEEAVSVDGTRIIPTGAKAWGEVVSASESGAAGKAGQLSARLLYVDVPAGRISIRGESSGKGPGGAGATVMGVIGLGPLGLFTRGTNAKLKAGQIFNGYTVQDVIFDPATAKLQEVADTAPPLAVPVPK